MLSSLAILAVLSPALVLANFRIECGILTHERLDPVVSPGAVSGHVHDIAGGSNLAATVTTGSLRKSACTSCEVKQDKSLYWTPSLYFQWANGSFSMVPSEALTAYYYTTGYEEKNLPMPAGLRMISGNRAFHSAAISNRMLIKSHVAFLRSNQNTTSQVYGAVNFACIGSGERDTPYLPSYNCPAGIRADVYL